MFGREFTLFKLFGFKVRINISWLFLAFLVAWSLAQGFFPFFIPELSATEYWLLGGAGVVGLLISIVLHEFSHSLVARRYGLPIRGISLFIFGGIAEMEDEPPSPKAEFMMAIAGPLASFAIAAILWQFVGFEPGQTVPGWGEAVAFYLAYLNVVLGVFNLIPAYPLDGGRVLRSALWAWSRDLDKATFWASNVGRGFGLLLMGLGFLAILNGYPVGGMWWILIGLFLSQSAAGSYQQLRMRETLTGKTVADLMSRLPVAVPPDITLREFFNGYVYKYHHRMFPVVEGERVVGCMNTRSARGIPESEWERLRVSELSEACSADNTVNPATDATQALAQMSRSGNTRLVVLDGGRLSGIVTARDLLKYVGEGRGRA